MSLFVATSFLSAALLFSVQPMFTKLVLPVLGSSAAVWSIAMVFFQVLLLLGYGYAHILVRFCRPGHVLPIHAAVAVLAVSALPIALPQGWGEAPGSGQAFWLIGLFAAAVGLPFFWLSANGPLLQAWFARTSEPGAKEPYFLYAASNIGSFSALIAYPLLIEPILPLGTQTRVWAGGFLLLMLALLASGFFAWGNAAPSAESASAEGDAAKAVGWRDRLAWTLLAVVPSGLLVSVTAHISTDIAAVPLLWVVPLALFLLTFVLVFSERALLPPQAMVRVQAWTLALAILSFVLPFPLWAGIPLHLAAFFSSAMVCHDVLYRRRPRAGDLTEFYLFMSLGGCLGGIFCALVAPRIFSTILEYPLFLVLGLFCRADALSGLRARRKTALVWLAVCGALVAAGWLLSVSPPIAGLAKVGLVVGFALAAMASWRTPARYGPACVAAALVASVISFSSRGEENIRSFFGVHRLSLSADGRFRQLSHGTTIHGAVRLLDDAGHPRIGPPEPTTYYTREGGIGQGIAAIRQIHGGRLASVAAVGLGTGSLACHIAEGESWTFYEIDAAVVEIARDPSKFGFVSACAPDVPIVVGDGRLTLAKARGGKDLIVIDAFSSDSIPAHLMTAEAFALYRSKLGPHGALLVHISNRNLDLGQILAGVAGQTGLVAYRLTETTSEPFEARYRTNTHVMAFAADPADLGRLATEGVWKRVEPDPARRVWTDDFSNVIEAMIDKYRG